MHANDCTMHTHTYMLTPAHYTLHTTHYSRHRHNTLEQPRTVLAAPLSGHSKYNLLQENWGKVRPLCSSSSFVVLIGWLVVVIPLLPVLAVL